MKALLIYATGQTEAINYAGGQFYERQEQVQNVHDRNHASVNVVRRFEAVSCENANTTVDGAIAPGAWGQGNDGFVVLVEKRPLPPPEKKDEAPVLEVADNDKDTVLEGVPEDRSTNPYPTPSA